GGVRQTDRGRNGEVGEGGAGGRTEAGVTAELQFVGWVSLTNPPYKATPYLPLNAALRRSFTASFASSASSLSLTSWSARWARPDCSDGPCASTVSVTKRFSVFSTSGENSVISCAIFSAAGTCCPVGTTSLPMPILQAR